jgi:pimeloyl-ACP methyl ester carboxylesterase
MHLLLLPGMDGTGRLFEPLARALPPSLHHVIVSYPGDQPLDYAQLLPLVEAAVPPADDFLVLGESFSGPLAVLLAASRPPRLRGMVLCASFVRSPLPLPATWLRWLVHPLLFRLTPMPLVRRMLLGPHRATPLGGQLQMALAEVSPSVLAARAQAVLDIDVGRQLQSCPVPVLYLQARGDRLVGAGSLAYVRRMCPAVEVVSLPGPHLLLQVAAREVARVIEQFAQRCAVGRPGEGVNVQSGE